MATDGEETIPGSPWYAKFFEYWKNRNRVGPGKVELPDCDFFNVGPRRTLRILKPTLKSGWYYENTNERPESIIDNFFTRWSRRPHSSGNCRCSFRQSKRASTAEEQIISDELNRIRTSLCEADKNERAIEELEQRVSVNLQKLQVADPENEPTKVEEKSMTNVINDTKDEQAEEQTIKNKIVKDLEKYINVLLEEILDDTVKYVAGAGDTLIKDVRSSKKRNDCLTLRRSNEESCGNEESFNDISFSFHPERIKRNEEEEEGSAGKSEALNGGNEGYVNRGFIGSTSDPDSLDFYLRRSIGGTEVTLEQLDCIDSGINSVETIEFQPDQEPSLEQSLLKIIDEKLGRTALRNSWEDLSTDGQGSYAQGQPTKRTGEMVIPRSGEQLSNDQGTGRSEVTGKNDAERSEPQDSSVQTSGGIDISTDNLESAGVDAAVDLKELGETVNEPSFEKLRLEFKGSGDESSFGAKKGNAIAMLREKFTANPIDEADRRSLEKCSWNEKMGTFEMKREAASIELEDYRKTWPNIEENATSTCYEQNPRDLITFRRNRKPMIVFLHGFGSSADIFEHQLRYFSSLGYPCIAPDMLGHGMSSAPDRSRDYHFNKLLKDLDTILCHYAFKPGQKCVLVAHNYG